MDSTNEHCGAEFETSPRRYLFSTTPHTALGTDHRRLADISPAKSFLDCLPSLPTRGPTSAAIFTGPQSFEAHRWGMRDSVRLAILVSRKPVEDFEALYPGYRRPRDALDAASLALDHMDSTATNAADRAGRELTRIAFQTARQGIPKDHLQGVWAAANAARAVAWEVHGTRAQVYLRQAVEVSTQADRHMNDRIKLWLDFYLGTRAVLQETTDYRGREWRAE